jgi:hypothetical protein
MTSLKLYTHHHSKVVCAVLLLLLFRGTFVHAQQGTSAHQEIAPLKIFASEIIPPPDDYNGAIAMITFFKAKPGQFDVYSHWMAVTAKPVDDWAREHGAFESVKTYANPDLNAPWSHMRIFIFKSRDQMKAMGKVMNAAHLAVFPDPEKREAAIGHKDQMRSSVGAPLLMEVVQQ